MSGVPTFSPRQFLKSREALLVHFNTPMTSHPTGFPKDLHDARKLVATEIPFSTIQVTDNGPWQVRPPSDANAVGSVGLIVDIKDVGSVTSVGYCDIGSNSRIAGYSKGLGQPPSDQTCAESIDRRGPKGHNEWVVQDYIVLGIFIFLPAGAFIVGSGERDCFLPEVLSTFPNDRIISILSGNFLEYDRGNQSWVTVPFANIVPP
jgi:hypothetical protein